MVPYNTGPHGRVWPAREQSEVHRWRTRSSRPGQSWSLAVGVRLVWIVWPADQQVDVWRPGAGQPAATLTAGDSLDGLDALPGFSYPVANLFK